MLRVVVVDDEVLIRSGLTMILEAAHDIVVVGSVGGADAVATISRERPDVVLLDIRMPDRNGLDILAEVRATPEPPVIAILTTFDADDYVSVALAGGAAGFLVKDTDPSLLPGLVRTLAAGGIVLSPQIAGTVIDGYLGAGDRGASRLIGALTDREQQVLSQLSTGASNVQIARTMHLGLGTVKDHVSVILGKLQVTTRLEAALVAERGGLTTRQI